MKKKTKKQKQQHAFWFKILLFTLLLLLILLVWIGSSKTAIADLEQFLNPNDPPSVMPIRPTTIKKSPTPAETTYTLTFEDTLPEPFTDSHTDNSNSSAPPPEKRHVLAIIIDDVGYSLKALERLLQLPYTVTVSILPDSPYAEEAARMAHQHGIKVMLHMPMQTSNPKYQQKMEKFYLHEDMSEEEFISVFEAALEKVPYAVGVNNHMGSALTQNARAMQWLMELCKKHDLFFIDSRTSSASVAAKEAEKAGIAWNQRDIFLDHSVEPEKLQKAWNSTLNCVTKSDHCLLLAHPHPETLNFLEHNVEGLNAYAFVTASQLLNN